MTCLMSRICAKADGCDIHIGTKIEKCSAFRERQTNFSRITASPEALAEFITGLIGIGKCSWCIDGGNPDSCPCDFGKQCLFEGDGCLELLKQESE